MCHSVDLGGEGPKSVVGANGLREFVMLPEWTVNNFRSTRSEERRVGKECVP